MNKLKSVQAMTDKVSHLSLRLSENILKLWWRVRKLWRYYGYRNLKAMFFKICIFFYKRAFFFWFLLIELVLLITLELVLFYQIYHNCLRNVGFLLTNLRKKNEMTQWQMLDSLFNSVHFSRNFIICILFYFLNILLYTDQILYHLYLDLYTGF